MKKYHEPAGQKNSERKKESTNCQIHIDPGVQIDIVKDLKEQHKAERAEDKAASDKQLFWTKVAAVLVFLYTLFSAWQVKIAKDTFNAANRPYVGISSISTKHHKGNVGTGSQLAIRQDHNEKRMNIAAEIKNFGPVPGTKFISEWKIFLGGVEQKGLKKIPHQPSTIFPGQSVFMAANFWGANYTAIMKGTAPLMIEVTTEYDGPSGRYKECSKHQFEPGVNAFLDLGLGCN